MRIAQKSGLPAFLASPPALVLPLLLLGACAAPTPPPVRGNLATWLDGDRATAPVEEVVEAAGTPGGETEPLTAQASQAVRNGLEERLAAPGGEDEPAEVVRLRRALAHLKAERLDHAAVELKDLLEARPDHFVVLTLLANVRLRQGKYDQALDLVERALARAPEDMESRLVQAWAHTLRRQEGDLERAVRLYREIPSAAFPEGRRDHLLARALLQLDRVEEALALVEKALAQGGENAPLLEDKVAALLRLGRDEEAARTCRRLVEPPHGPDLGKLWFYAKVLRRAGRFDRASRVIDSILVAQGPELEAFCTQHNMSRTRLERLAELVRREGKAGRRIGFLPGEELAICLAPGGGKEKRVALARLTAKGSAAHYREALLACLADSSPEIRRDALKALSLRGLDPEKDRELFDRALADPDYKVRALAIQLLGTRAGEGARGKLLEALAREEKGYVFACICRALETLTGEQVFFLSGEEEKPEARARIRRAWREKLAP